MNTFHFHTLAFYTPNDKLTGDLKRGFEGIQGTSCCYRLSYGLNMSGYVLPGQSFRRNPTHRATIDGKKWNFHLVVDEIEYFLDHELKWSYENISHENGKKLKQADMINNIGGKFGVILFWVEPYGLHVDLWRGNKLHRKGMSLNMFGDSKSVWLYETSRH